MLSYVMIIIDLSPAPHEYSFAIIY